MVTPTNSNFPQKSPVKLPMTKVEPNSRLEKSQPQLSCLGPPCQRPSLSCLCLELLVPAFSLYAWVVCVPGIHKTLSNQALSIPQSSYPAEGERIQPIQKRRLRLTCWTAPPLFTKAPPPLRNGRTPPEVSGRQTCTEVFRSLLTLARQIGTSSGFQGYHTPHLPPSHFTPPTTGVVVARRRERGARAA